MDIVEKRQRKAEATRKWIKDNPGKVIAYRRKHREYNNERAKKWATDNPDKAKEKNRKYNARRYEEDPEKCRRRSRDYYHNNKLKVKDKRLRTEYGISLEEYKDMVGTLCPICGRSFGEHTPHIDHDHKTGKVRGVLCSKCNLGLGHFNDNIDILLNAIEYLRKGGLTWL
jgi:hypothetical protein